MTAKTATKEELAVRYDRQVRLWGSQTQQRLQQTALHVHWEDSFAGAGAELVKNLVLGGIGQLTVSSGSNANKTSTPTMAELQTNLFLLQRQTRLRAETITKEGAVVEGLSALNPFVSVSAVPLSSVLTAAVDSAADNEGRSETEELKVVIAIGCTGDQLLAHYESLRTKLEAEHKKKKGNDSDGGDKIVLVSMNHVGRNALAVLTPVVAAATTSEHQRTVGTKSPREDSGVTTTTNPAAHSLPSDPLNHLLQDQGYLALQPTGYQAIAATLFEPNKPGGSSESSSRSSSKSTPPPPPCISSSIIESASLGGILSQQLIARIGKGLAGQEPTDFGWLLLDGTTHEVSCMVGSM